jgi:hypothetical protein
VDALVALRNRSARTADVRNTCLPEGEVTSPANRRRAYQQARAQSRAARRMASRTARIAQWWAALPDPKPDFFTPAHLSAELGLPMRAIATALRWLGWHGVTRHERGRQRRLWLSPGSKVRPRNRGRPMLYAPLLAPNPDDTPAVIHSSPQSLHPQHFSRKPK